jgi:uncharacterized protein involved in exopolysaccharide biosynthesis/Mrp family chromosome partitioning ATPase
MNSDYPAQDADVGTPGGGLAITDIYYVLFRRKWIVVMGAILGLLAAAALWKKKQPLYESEAKLLVKYVLETPAIVVPGTEFKLQSTDDSGAAVLNSEIEILKSIDSLQQVARAVGPDKILPKGADTNDVDRAAGLIAKRLKTVPLQRSKIVLLQFQHADPSVPQPVLHEVIEAYLKKHEQTHRSLGVSEDTLARQRDELRGSLASAERELKQLKGKAGVHSLEDSKKENVKLEANIRQEFFTAQGELAQRQASYEALRQQQPAGAATTTPLTEIPAAVIDEYRHIAQQVSTLTSEVIRLSAGLTAESPIVKTNQIRLASARARKNQMETNHPALLSLATATPALPTALQPAAVTAGVTPAMDLNKLAVEVKALESKTATLSNQLELVRAELKQIEDVEGQITDLERKRASLEKQLAFVEQSLAQAKFNAALGDRQNTSINKVQAPSPPYRDYAQLYKKMAMAVVGGLIAGLVLAFVIELVLDRTLKRAKDVEKLLHLPVFLSIPVLRLRSLLLPAGGNGTPSGTELTKPDGPSGTGPGAGGQSKPEAPQPDHELKPYQDALRDRLVTYFDIRDMTHKPKLIAVTGCVEGAGVSSVAAGLAASLSETGDGNVLLVDMREQKGAAHAFTRGLPACGLAAALENETRESAQVQNNLYVVSANSVDQKLQRIIPQQFSHFVPKLKASDYDYIIFDMPPVGQTSITAKVARFMDMVLMVIESEKTDRDVAKRASDLLAESKASVAAVLNKRRRYVPEWLQQDFH